MAAPLINRIANSGITTLNLEDYYPSHEVVTLDIKDYLFKGFILKEKDFRTSLKEHDWSSYQDKVLCVFCSTDAIIPVWAYMLVSSYATQSTFKIYIGNREEYLKHHFYDVLDELQVDKYEGARVVIKGCSNKPVPPSAYAYLTELLRPIVKSIMYGEPCSTVPIYKKPLKRVR